MHDLFLIGVNEIIQDVRMRLDTEFDLKDLGIKHYFLGMEVWQNADGISLGQGNNVVDESEEIQNAGLQGDIHTYGIEIEATL